MPKRKSANPFPFASRIGARRGGRTKRGGGGGMTISDSLAARLMRVGALPRNKAKGRLLNLQAGWRKSWGGLYRQTGSSGPRDVSLSAKKPGWRLSERGNVYFENRRNRSDMPGKRR